MGGFATRLVALFSFCVILPTLYAQKPGSRYALLIGVKKYNPSAGLSDLKFTENDVENLREVLVKRCGYPAENVILLTTSEAVKRGKPGFEPTARNIRRALKQVMLRCKEEDTLLLAFSGHGAQFTNKKENYFCPTDADFTNRERLIDLEKEVYQQLADKNKCKARVRLLFVDACRNDPRDTGAKSRRKKLNLSDVNSPQNVELPKGLLAMFSCAASQESYEDADLKRGIFFHYVIEGLRGKAGRAPNKKIDHLELYSYVRNQVKDHSLKLRRDQNPELKGNFTGSILLFDPALKKLIDPPISRFPRMIVGVLDGHDQIAIQARALSPDGRRIVSGSKDKTLVVWDATTNRRLLTLRGHSKDVTDVVFSNDSSRVISASMDRTVRIWDVKTGREIKRFDHKITSVRSVAISSRDSMIAAGCDDHHIHLWDVATGRRVDMLKGHQQLVTSLKFSPKRNLLASASSAEKENEVFLWDLSLGRRKISGRLQGHEKGIIALSFSADGRKLLSSGNDRTVRLWDVTTKKEILGKPIKVRRWAYGAALSPDAKWIVTGGRGKKIELWDARTGKQVPTALEGHTSSIERVTLSPDARWVISAGRDGTVRIWDAQQLSSRIP